MSKSQFFIKCTGLIEFSPWVTKSIIIIGSDMLKNTACLLICSAFYYAKKIWLKLWCAWFQGSYSSYTLSDVMVFAFVSFTNWNKNCWGSLHCHVSLEAVGILAVTI